MGKQGRIDNRQARNEPSGGGGKLIIAVVVVIAIIFAVVLIVKNNGSGKKSTTATNIDNQPVSAEMLAKLTGLTASQFNSTGVGSIDTFPKSQTGDVLTKDGKPTVFYMGAEYCPYCAAERWATIIALSRFGTFSNLHTMSSSSTDSFASTPTFTFNGAIYTGTFISFDSVELNSNKEIKGSPGHYPTLQTPTAEQAAIVQKFNPDGGIPFISFGNQFVIGGASYSPEVVHGKTHDQIIAALSDPNSKVAKAIIGGANVMTAAICKLTNNQPADVCTPEITNLTRKF